MVTVKFILSDDTLMDVRLTCGLSLPLSLKSLDHQETVLQVSHLRTIPLLGSIEMPQERIERQLFVKI